MHIVEVTAASLRFADAVPGVAPADGFVWIYLERADFAAHADALQQAAQRLGGSALLDVHLADLVSESHPSDYDATSVYDIVIFRRLASLAEAQQNGTPPGAGRARDAFARIDSRPVGFAIFDRLLISVHPPGCHSARGFIQRFLADAQLSVNAASARNRAPQSPADLVLRMVNTLVDGYLDLRKDLTAALEQVQQDLLAPQPRPAAWNDVIHARRRLHLLEDLCEEQHDALQEWLDTLRELPLATYADDAALAQARRDQLVARARDVIEHIDRVLHHARRLEQAADTAVQIHFGAQGQRTNDIMRTLTAVTAIFLPLNLFTGFFGMNFEHLPLIHSTGGMWVALGLLVLVAAGILVWFWRRRYITRSRK
ncbi:MAG: magnesium transporter CorA family protein [Ottowia sp.]|uniref:magnesium transporter CorA family protein n=1 Tax=Ottowia sp. TaxID=1898956 RepID=UPI0039E42C6D